MPGRMERPPMRPEQPKQTEEEADTPQPPQESKSTRPEPTPKWDGGPLEQEEG